MAIHRCARGYPSLLGYWPGNGHRRIVRAALRGHTLDGYLIMPLLPRTNILTHHMLVEAGACAEQRKVFVETFGYKVKVSQTSLSKAHDVGLWLTWFGEHFSRNKDAWNVDLALWSHNRFPTDKEQWDYIIEMVMRHCTWIY
jgi:hypothetical protein